MTDRIPIKGVFDAGKSIGLAEFASGDTLGIAQGGTGKTTAIEALAAFGGQPNDNFIINGDFSVWQRATSQNTSGMKSADHWAFYFNAGTLSATKAPFPSGGGEAFDNLQYCVQVIFAGASGAGDYAYAQYNSEDVERFSGKTVTLQFRAYSVAAQQIAIEFAQAFGTGGSAAVVGISPTKLSVGPGWTYHTLTVDMPSVVGKTIGAGSCSILLFWFSGGSSFNARNGSLGVKSGDVVITGVKWELGSVATKLIRRSYAEELLLCQRYYEKSYPIDVAPGTSNSQSGFSWAPYLTGLPSATYVAGTSVKYSTRKRTTPTLVAYSPSSGTQNKAYCVARSVDVDISLANGSDHGFIWYANQGGATTSINVYAHWSADAEL